MDGGRLRHAGEGGAGRKRGRRPDHGLPGPALSHRARSIASPPPAFAAGARGDRWDHGRRSEVLCLPHPDWLHHTLTVTGPEAELAAFRQAACGAGVTPWVYDYDRMAEDWFNLMVAPPPPLRRTISAAGARILANQLRDAVWERHEAAVSQVGVSKACPFDLHALVPVPFESCGWDRTIQGRSPGSGSTGARPGACARSCRRRARASRRRCPIAQRVITPRSAAGSGRRTGPPGRRSARWRRWPALSVAIQPSYGLEETEAAGARPRRAAAAAGAGRAASLPPNAGCRSLPCRLFKADQAVKMAGRLRDGSAVDPRERAGRRRRRPSGDRGARLRPALAPPRRARDLAAARLGREPGGAAASSAPTSPTRKRCAPGSPR